MTQLRKKMKELSAAHDVIVRNSQVLLKQITTEVEGSGSGHLDPTLKENLSLFRLTADAMVKASEGYLLQARSVEKRWRRDMQSERDLRLRLQENMETMANQIHGLENDAKCSVGGAGGGRGHRSASQGSREVVLSPSAATDTGRGDSVQERARDSSVGGEEGDSQTDRDLQTSQICSGRDAGPSPHVLSLLHYQLSTETDWKCLHLV
jgi:hypothetical protein